MKRACIILAPPLVFALTAALAWLVRSPAEKVHAPESTQVSNVGQSETEEHDTAILNQLEYKIVHYPAQAAKICDAKGMEAALESDILTSCTPEGGLSAVQYSMRWAEKSPVGMFNWLIQKTAYSEASKTFPVYLLFGSWAKKDMGAALSAVFKIPNRDLRQQALVTTFEVLCESDPTRARELMIQNLNLFPTDGRRPIFNAAKPTCEILLSLPPSKERTNLLAMVLTDMSDYDAEKASQAVAVWQQQPEDVRRDLVAAGFTCGKEFAEKFDGLEHLMREHAETSGDYASVERFIEAYGPVLAKRDFTSALSWTQAYLKGKTRVERRAELFEFAASKNFDATIAIWQTLPDSFLKARAAGAISRGAPADWKSEVETLLQSLTSRYRDQAR